MDKKKLKKMGQAGCLIAFVAMALSCGSSESARKNTYDAIDGFVEGWQYSKSLSYEPSTTSDEMEVSESAATEDVETETTEAVLAANQKTS